MPCKRYRFEHYPCAQISHDSQSRGKRATDRSEMPGAGSGLTVTITGTFSAMRAGRVCFHRVDFDVGRLGAAHHPRDKFVPAIQRVGA